jgi:hypothetical protein
MDQFDANMDRTGPSYGGTDLSGSDALDTLVRDGTIAEFSALVAHSGYQHNADYIEAASKAAFHAENFGEKLQREVSGWRAKTGMNTRLETPPVIGPVMTAGANIAKGAASGVGAIGSGVRGLAEDYLDRQSPLYDPVRGFGAFIQEKMAYTAAAVDPNSIQEYKDVHGVRDFGEWLGGKVAESVGFMAPMVLAGATPAGWVGSTSVGLGQGFGMATDALEARGIEGDDLKRYRLGMGLVYGALNTALGGMATNALTATATRKIGDLAGKSMALHAANHVGMEGIKGGAMMAFQDAFTLAALAAADGKQGEAAIDRALEAISDPQNQARILESGVVGFAFGGAMGVAGARGHAKAARAANEAKTKGQWQETPEGKPVWTEGEKPVEGEQSQAEQPAKPENTAVNVEALKARKADFEAELATLNPEETKAPEALTHEAIAPISPEEQKLLDEHGDLVTQHASVKAAIDKINLGAVRSETGEYDRLLAGVDAGIKRHEDAQAAEAEQRKAEASAELQRHEAEIARRSPKAAKAYGKKHGAAIEALRQGAPETGDSQALAELRADRETILADKAKAAANTGDVQASAAIRKHLVELGERIRQVAPQAKEIADRAGMLAEIEKSKEGYEKSKLAHGEATRRNDLRAVHVELLKRNIAEIDKRIAEAPKAQASGGKPAAPSAKTKAPARQPTAPIAGKPLGEPIKVITPDGSMEVQARPVLVELAELTHAAGDTQPRDRERSESAVANSERAQRLDPEQLQPNRVSDAGAPLVTPEGEIISGNGRAMSIREAYGDPALKDRADAYRASLGPEAEGMREPVLVMQLPPMERADVVRLADLSNRSRIQSMSATERAQRDARAAGPDVMGLYRGGDPTSPENRYFADAFFLKTVTAGELSEMSKNGRLTKGGVDRVNAALLAAAYDDAGALALALESTDSHVKSIAGAMRDTAGLFSQLRSAIHSGVVPREYDISATITNAMQTAERLRQRRVSLADHLAQSDMYAEIDPVEATVLRAFYGEDGRRAASQKAISEFLSAYAEEALRKQGGGLFADTTTPLDVAKLAGGKGVDASTVRKASRERSLAHELFKALGEVAPEKARQFEKEFGPQQPPANTVHPAAPYHPDAGDKIRAGVFAALADDPYFLDADKLTARVAMHRVAMEFDRDPASRTMGEFAEAVRGAVGADMLGQGMERAGYDISETAAKVAKPRRAPAPRKKTSAQPEQAEPTPITSRPDARSAFYDVLESKARLNGEALAKKLGVSVGELRTLVDDAVSAGWLTKGQDGKFRRVASNRRPARPVVASAATSAAKPASSAAPRSLLDVLKGPHLRKDWARLVGVSEERLAPMIESAEAKGWLIRDRNGRLRRNPKAWAEGVKPAAKKAAKEAPKVEAPAQSQDLRARIYRAAYEAAGNRFDFSGYISDLRKLLPDVSRHDLDAELKKMSLDEDSGLLLYHEDNPINLKNEHRAGSVAFGGADIMSKGSDSANVRHKVWLDSAKVPAGVVSAKAGKSSSIDSAAIAAKSFPDAPTRQTRAGTENPATSLRQVMGDLRQTLGLTVRFGRLDPGARAAARAAQGELHGQSSRDTGVIRLRDQRDYDTNTHEAGHQFHDRYLAEIDALVATHQAEMQNMAAAHATAAASPREQFAEFFRRYMTAPVNAERMAPNFFRDFEELIDARDPQALQALQGLQTAYQRWLTQSSSAAVRSEVVYHETRGWWSRFRDAGEETSFAQAASWQINKMYTFSIGELHPLKVARDALLEIAGRNLSRRDLTLKTANDFYKLFRITKGAYAAGHVDIMEGVRSYRGIDPNGPSLRDAITHAMGGRSGSQWSQAMVEKFDAYLASRRIVQEYARLAAGELDRAPDKLSLADHEQAVASLEGENPQFRRGAQMVYAFLAALLRKQRDAGFITNEVYQTLIARQDYVPLMRHMQDFGDYAQSFSEGRTTAGGRNERGLLRRFQGSTRDIKSPIQSIAQRSYDTSFAIARNDAFRAMDRLAAAAGPGGGAIAERVPAAFGQDNPKDNIVYFWEGGHRRSLKLADGELGDMMIDAVTSLGGRATDFWVEIASLPARAVRTGVTVSPDFVASNFIRDQIATWVNTEGYTPFGSGARGAYGNLTLNQWARRYGSFGGLSGGAITDEVQMRVDRDIQRMRTHGVEVRSFLNPLKAYQKFLETSESSTRIGLFEATFRRALGDGMTQYEALVEASYVSRDVLDFDRHGSGMDIMRKIIPFMNAGLQGIDRYVRALRGREDSRTNLRGVTSPFSEPGQQPVLSAGDRRAMPLSRQALIKSIVPLGLVSLALSYLYADDPEFDEIGEAIRTTHWIIKGGHNANGKPIWIRIPKPFEVAAFADVVERGFDYAYKGDKAAGGKAIRSIFDLSLPAMNAPALFLPIELALNRNVHFGGPIVKDEGLPADMQYDAYTSQFSKKLGAAVGVAPAYIDHVVTSMGGSGGRELLNMSNRLAGPVSPATVDTPFLRRFMTDPNKGSTTATEFWNLMGQSGGKFTTAAKGYKQVLEKERDPVAAQERLNKMPDDERVYSIMTEHGGPDDKQLHPLYRAQTVCAAAGAIMKEINLRGAIDIKAHVKKGKEPERVELTRDDARRVIDILRDYQVREYSNALKIMDIPGWGQRPIRETDGLLEELKAVSPVVAKEFNDKLTDKKRREKVYDFDEVKELWPRVRAAVLANGTQTDLRKFRP